MSPRKPTSPSTPNKESDNEDKKQPYKKTSPLAKYTTPIRNVYAASLKTTITDISDKNMDDLKVNTPSSDLIAEMGLDPPPRTEYSPKSMGLKVANLRCCAIDAGVNSAIIFRFEPNGSWSEKLLVDEIYTNKREWTTTMGFINDKRFEWYENNQVQYNPKRYAVRLFVLQTRKPVIVKEKLMKQGQFICQQVNLANVQYSTQIDKKVIEVAEVNEELITWIPPGAKHGAVWADVIGIDAAYKQLVDKIGNPNGQEDFYIENKAFIDAYFRSGTYSLNFARRLGAPLEEVHPDLRSPNFLNPDDEPNDVDPEL